MLALVAAGAFWVRPPSPPVDATGGSAASPVSASPAGQSSATTRCPDVTLADGSVDAGDVRITLSLTPQPPVAFAKIRVRVRAESGGAPVALEGGRVSFEMTMPMGDHRYSLVPGDGRMAGSRGRPPDSVRAGSGAGTRPSRGPSPDRPRTARFRLDLAPPRSTGRPVIQTIDLARLPDARPPRRLRALRRDVLAVRPVRVAPVRRTRRRTCRAAFAAQLWYTAGRVVTYAVLGAARRGARRRRRSSPAALLGLQRAASVVAGRRPRRLGARGALRPRPGLLVRRKPLRPRRGRAEGTRARPPLRDRALPRPACRAASSTRPSSRRWRAAARSKARPRSPCSASGRRRHSSASRSPTSCWPATGRRQPPLAGVPAGDGALVPLDGAVGPAMTHA